MRLPRSFLSRAMLVVGASAVLYAAAALLLGWREIARELAAVPARLLLWLAGLSLTNYCLRFWRWELYLRSLQVRLPLRTSAILYFASYVMVVTPGKVGEVFKAGVLQDRFGVPLARGVPVVLAERISDFLAVVLLAAASAAFWPGPLSGLAAALAAAAALAILLVACQQPALRARLLARAGRHPWLVRRGWAWEDSRQALDSLLAGRLTTLGLLLSLAAWLCEGLELWLVCGQLGQPVSAGESVFVYCAGTLVGTLFFLPGGLGGTEATIIAMLAALGLSTGAAAGAALIVRLLTLWLAMVIGLAFFLGWRRLLLGEERARSGSAARN